MNKEELHSKLKSAPVTITVDEFIEVYGNDDSRKINKETLCRADILARTYGLSVVKNKVELPTDNPEETILSYEYFFSK